MDDLLLYPYPTYIANKTVAGCVAAMVGISLIAWFIQSCQARFRPPRISFLLLASHLTIVIELIVRATVPEDRQNSKTIFIIVNSLFALSQRMIIISNYVFILEVHYVRSLSSRLILIGAISCAIMSAILMVPINMLSFDPEKINASFLFRKLSASFLFAVAILFYPVWYWSKTVKDMTMQAIILVIVSSTLCAIATLFTIIQSIPSFYDQTYSHEVWFYALQIAPIVFAHFAWSVFHPKRSLVSSEPLISATGDDLSRL
ncbi:unnamed protein product [Rotaria magnacalcarata]|uniref:Uncharacterized protein n=1 Tax=Rotaria magnacalcarata TaxID=392030 RepID=A0A816WLD8_9BILA|nr:unnamed protein product [Rotaria magnacalcarata]CAF1656938.1 unnamed protein product [Rotaria magnacalcarata]CAF2076277.1 unnamed protein product [Rotaria magnacalcarata]CAF2100628.1 unnamed protein product [Rotaria magnacalcarata]CAF2136760.1 unnamed protein product [Rotaria magnacalcarata]